MAFNACTHASQEAGHHDLDDPCRLAGVQSQDRLATLSGR